MDTSAVSNFISSTSGSWDSDTIDDRISIVWSQDADKLPVSSTTVSDTPCMNPSEASYPSSYRPFDAEYRPGSCSTSVTNGLTYDPRYEKEDITVSELELQEDNGVFDYKAREFGRGRYYNERDDERMLEKVVHNLWTRPNLHWDLECESNAATTRAAMYTAISDPYQFPTRIITAAVFAFIAMSIEIFGMCCGVVQGGLTNPKAMFMTRAASMCCAAIFAINIVWMANTAATTIRDSKDKVHDLSLVNACSDDVSQLPADTIEDDFDKGADAALLAANLTYGLLVTYGLSICLIV